MKETFFFCAFFLCYYLLAKQNEITTARDGFLAIATDARAAGQGDIGVATSADVFSQQWNPAKYVFSSKSFEIGITQMFVGKREINEFSQATLTFYNKLDNRRAYALSLRHYANSLDQFDVFGTVVRTHEVAISGSYTMKLSNTFALAVAGRFISLKSKLPLIDGFNRGASSGLYGIDVSGFYYGNEMAYDSFNARWRAGFNFSNLRGQSVNDDKDIEIYAPSMLKVGLGLDFIFDQDRQLAVTTEYKTLLESYTKNERGEPLQFGLEGSVMAVGLEFGFKEKLLLRTGYSLGINRVTDTFASIGTGFRGRFVDLDMSLLLGLSDEENSVRQKLRLSLGLNLDEVFRN